MNPPSDRVHCSLLSQDISLDFVIIEKQKSMAINPPERFFRVARNAILLARSDRPRPATREPSNRFKRAFWPVSMQPLSIVRDRFRRNLHPFIIITYLNFPDLLASRQRVTSQHMVRFRQIKKFSLCFQFPLFGKRFARECFA